MFKMEQEEYAKEEINWSYIEFVDNKDVLDLIEKVFFLLFPFLSFSKALRIHLIHFVLEAFVRIYERGL